jgi:hypothetical protein
MLILKRKIIMKKSKNKHMTNSRYIFITFLIMMICNSCIGFRTNSLKNKNPTSFVFHTSLNKLRNIIKKDFVIDRSKNINDLMNVQDISKKSWNILTVNDSNFPIKGEIFKMEENRFDLYLYSSSNPIISYSKVYKKFWKSLKYRAEFQLHFATVSENETKITIITHNPKVLYWSLNIFSGHPFAEYKTVQPTTIEEYEILLRIGNLVGEEDMPPLKLP